MALTNQQCSVLKQGHYSTFLAFLRLQTRQVPCTGYRYLVTIMLKLFRKSKIDILKRICKKNCFGVSLKLIRQFICGYILKFLIIPKRPTRTLDQLKSIIRKCWKRKYSRCLVYFSFSFSFFLIIPSGCQCHILQRNSKNLQRLQLHV